MLGTVQSWSTKEVGSKSTKSILKTNKETALISINLPLKPPKEIVQKSKAAPSRLKVCLWKYGYFVSSKSVQRELDSKSTTLITFLELIKKKKIKSDAASIKSSTIQEINNPQEINQDTLEDNWIEEPKITLFSIDSELAKYKFETVNPVFYNHFII